MNAVAILDYLDWGKNLDPYNARQTKVTYNDGETIIGEFYKFNNDPPDLTSNQWCIVIKGEYQIIDGNRIATLKDAGVNPK